MAVKFLDEDPQTQTQTQPQSKGVTFLDEGEGESASQPLPTRKKYAYLSDVGMTVDYPDGMSTDQLNESVQKEVYKRPRFNFYDGLSPASLGAIAGESIHAEAQRFGTKMVTEPAKALVRGVEAIPVGASRVMSWIGDNLASEEEVSYKNPLTGKTETIKRDPNVIEKTIGEGLKAWGNNAIKHYELRQKDGFEAPDKEVFEGSFLSNPSWTRTAALVMEGLPVTATAAAITFATKNPWAGSASIGLLEGSKQYLEAKQAGKSQAESNVIGGVSVGVSTWLEQLPLEKYLEGKGALVGAAYEGGQEVVQTWAQNLIAKVGYDKTRDLFKGTIESLIAGAATGGMIGAITAGRAKIIDNIIQEAERKGAGYPAIEKMREYAADLILATKEEINAMLERDALAKQEKDLAELSGEGQTLEEALISDDDLDYINTFFQDEEAEADLEDAPAVTEEELKDSVDYTEIEPDRITEPVKETLQRISETDDFKDRADRYFELQGIIDQLAARREANERIIKGVKIRLFDDGYLREEMQDIPDKFITSSPGAITIHELSTKWGVSTDEAINMLINSAITKKDIKRVADARKEMAEMEKEMSRKNPQIQSAVDAINAQGKSPSRIMVTQSGLLKRLFKERFKGERIGFREGRQQGRQEVKSSKEILDRRRERIKLIRNNFGLTDNDLKKITKKDIRLMNNFEFKKFIDDIEALAATFQEKRQIKNQILFEIQDKELQKTENLRVYLKFPALDQMSVQQLNEFNQILADAQKGDEFLSVRKLETVKNTDLAGVKTGREALEILAKKMNVHVESLNNVTPGALHKFLFDAALARKDPFYQFLVDETNTSLLDGEQRYLEMEREVDDLVRKARKSRPLSLVERMIPTDELVFEWMEAKPEAKVKLAEKMTDAEIDLANYLQSRFAQFRDYLVEHEVLKKYRSYYITHIRKGFLENWKDDGLISAFKEAFNSYKEDEAVFKILDDDTQNILPLEKFFQFAMKRSGEMKPSNNVAKAFKAYTRAMIKKQSLDKIVPALEIYAYSLSPKQKTPRGLEMNRQLVKFVREWVNNKKGRKSSLGGILPQNGAVDMGLRTINAFITMLDLGLNIPVGISANVGEQVVTFVNLGSKKYALGIARMNTAKGKEVIKNHEGLIGKNPWKHLSDTASDIGSKFNSALFLLFQTSTVRANKIHLLGSMNEKEWEAGKVSAERQAEIKREIGRFRAVEGAKSIFGSTSAGDVLTKYKTWALPIIDTAIEDLGLISGLIKKGDKARAYREFGRAATITLFVLAMRGLVDDDDDSFIGQVTKKAYRESLTILGAMDPTVLSGVRMASFIGDLAESLKMIVSLEKYKSKKGYKGVSKLQQTLTPRAIKSLVKEKSKKVKSLL